MRWLFLFLPILLFAVNGDELKLEIEEQGSKSHFKLTITAKELPSSRLTLQVLEESGAEKLIVLERAGNSSEYSAVDFLPDPASGKRYFLRAINGAGESQAVMIKFVVFKK